MKEWDDEHWAHWMLQRGYTPLETAQYLEHDRYAYGVGFTSASERARPHNAREQGVTWLYRPTPKAITLHETRDSNDVTNILWGGAVGGAKSTASRWEAIAGCLFSEREKYRAIIIRRELEELRRSHLDNIDIEAEHMRRALGDGKAIKVTSQPPCATFERTGAKIIFAHASIDSDVLKYLSEEYDLFIGDEATLLKWKHITGIQARVRNDTKTGRVGRMILTTNPGGDSNAECIEHFITKTVSLEKNERYDPAQYKFIPASLYDNVYLMDADGTFSSYEARLYMLEPERRRQLLEGDWGAIVNQFFKFDPTTHVRAIA